jgi:hypothetical protein
VIRRDGISHVHFVSLFRLFTRYSSYVIVKVRAIQRIAFRVYFVNSRTTFAILFGSFPIRHCNQHLLTPLTDWIRSFGNLP